MWKGQVSSQNVSFIWEFIVRSKKYQDVSIAIYKARSIWTLFFI